MDTPGLPARSNEAILVQHSLTDIAIPRILFTMSWLPITVILTLAALIPAGMELLRHRRIRPFLLRPCARIRWHRRFPHAVHDDIRTFLKLFGSCFDYCYKAWSAFRPDDRVMQISDALNPPGLMVDGLIELEELEIAFAEVYGIGLRQVWHHEITLGELFELSRRTKLAVTPPRATPPRQ